MADEIMTGKAVLTGITDTGSAITMTGYASFIFDSVKAQHKFDLEAIKDEKKFDATLIATNPHKETDITWTPAGATKAAALATAVFIQPLSCVTLANFAVSSLNGRHVYVGDESIDLSNGPAKISLKIRRYDDVTQNTSLTTTVS